MVKIIDDFSLKAELKRIEKWIETYDNPDEFKWVKQLISKIDIKDFNLTFVTYSTSLNPDYIDLDSAYILYQEIFE